MAPSAINTPLDGQSEELTSDDEEEATVTPAKIDAFLHNLPLSDFLDHRTRTLGPFNIIEIDSFRIKVVQGESLGTFVDRLYRSGFPGTRMDHLEIVLRLGRENKVSISYFLETVIRRATENVAEILGWLADYRQVDVEEYGARALGTAAYRNDFRAVDILLDHHVDTNGSVSDPHPVQGCSCQMRVIDYAQLPRFDEQGQGASDEMVAYLLGEGAAQTTGFDKRLLGLLSCVLEHHKQYRSNLLANIEPIVERIRGFSNIAFEIESILETYILDLDEHSGLFLRGRYEVIEYLLDQGAKTDTGSPLAALILSHNLERVIRNVLDRTANINAYCSLLRPSHSSPAHIIRPLPYDTIRSVSPLQAAALRGKEGIIKILLQNGADVNCPARGSGGLTPLQAICRLATWSLQDREKKLRIVKLLFEHQANVNAAPAWNFGLSALQAAAYTGDTNVADLLISRGADINAPAYKYGGGTALVVAARRQHADMVRLLLKAGASTPAAGLTVSSFGDAHDDHRRILDLLHISATELTALYGDNGVASRDYHEYEAEWADDPTYDNKG